MSQRRQLSFLVAVLTVPVLVIGLLSIAAAVSRGSDPRSPSGSASEAVSGCAAADLDAIRWHAKRYPLMEAPDWYKLAHQGVAGPGHAIDDPAAAASWLDREWEAIGSPRAAEQELEPLPFGRGRLSRINLRPWKRRGGERNELLAAFVATAERLSPAPVAVRKGLDEASTCLASLSSAGELGISREVVSTFFDARRREGYPAVHHSERYRTSYAPAYRVVLPELLD